ncbi:AraC family transcriptional regulator [Mucilaginibacter gynuensis]|uniref:AraC family transcriptional regulator n=1 Tax=Mucilaginibacter gynuensis TaxID=1302236 RepID=A0ABP8G4Y8_9SPHI
MVPVLQKLPITHGAAFFAKTLKSPHFDVPWHHHNELEIILILEGGGNCFVGNYAGKFTAGDVFLIGANVPHTFKRQDDSGASGAVLVQFKSNFWGEDFISLPESAEIKNLFERAKCGIKVSDTCKTQLYSIIKALEQQTGFDRIINLCCCLNLIACDSEHQLLSTIDTNNFCSQQRDRLDKVFKFTIEEFTRPIALQEVAAIVSMSIPAFCEYFKKSVKKTYIEFLNEIRLSFACKLLIESELNISEIFLRCGYNTPANFNKQFLRYKGVSPSNFRKDFMVSSGNVQLRRAS